MTAARSCLSLFCLLILCRASVARLAEDQMLEACFREGDRQRASYKGRAKLSDWIRHQHTRGRFMIDISADRCHGFCDGIHRRDFLRAGALTAFGLTMGDALRARAHGAAAEGKARSVILLWMSGGPSHMDTWDPKPEAPEAYRGPARAIDTNVSGIQINERLPLLARQAHRYAIIRGMTHPSAQHITAHHCMLTGHMPGKAWDEDHLITQEERRSGVVHPSWGAVVAREASRQKEFLSELPPWVTVPMPPAWYGESAGFLGEKLEPFSAGRHPDRRKGYAVLAPPIEFGSSVENSRQALEQFARQLEARDTFEAVDTFCRQAYDRILGKARKAFDLSKEPDELRDRYGRTTFGQSCLLARRLVEHEVPFVTVTKGGWDTHYRNHDNMAVLNPDLDRGFSALLEDLHQRGLLASTIVVCAGEFGRTPRIQTHPRWDGGRHHFSDVFSVVVAGGGFEGGQVVGSSDDRASSVRDRPCYPWDLAASVYKLLGIDHHKPLPHPQRRNAYVTPLKLGVESGGLLTEIM